MITAVIKIINDGGKVTGKMFVSKDAIEGMGFEVFPENNIIEIRFGILKAYSLRGMFFENDCEEKKSKVVSLSDRCTVAIAQSINEASKLLTGDVFVDDEDTWVLDKKANPPYLLIYFRENVTRELRGGYRQEKDGVIYTYDAFPEGKNEIREWLDDDIPGIVTSLTVNLSTLEKQVELIPLCNSVFGTTKEGARIFDSKLTGGNVWAYVSTQKSIEVINSTLEKSKAQIPGLTRNVCRNFYAALNDPDRTKQFLGYFQFIEGFTLRTFSSLNYGNDAKKIFNLPERISEPMSKFFEVLFSESKTLSQRFNWCAIIAWEFLDENDVDFFLEAKKIRDKLSHGEHVEESELPVEKLKKLCLKLLGSNQS